MQSPYSSSPLWSPLMKRWMLVALALLLVLVLGVLGKIVPLVIAAVVVSYLLNPLVSFIDKWVLGFGPLKRVQSRGFAVGLTFILIVTLVVIVLLVVVPLLIGQLEEFGRNIPQLLDSLVKELERVLNQPVMFNGVPIIIGGEPFIPLKRLGELTGTQDIGQLLHIQNFDLVGATQTFIGSLGGITGPAFGFLGDAINTLVNFIFLVVMMFYLMKDGERFAESFVELAPESYRSDMRRLLRELALVWNAYLRGQLLIAFLTGLVVTIAGMLLGVPSPLILGLFSGLLQLIPNIGPFLAIWPPTILALVSQSATLPFLQGGGFALVVLLTWVIIQNVVLFVITPRVMGDTLHLHPFVILVAVMGGASVGGALGVILAVPFVASARLFLYYTYGKLTDQNPFPAPSRERKRRPSLVIRFIGFVWQKIQPRLPQGLRESLASDQPLNAIRLRIKRSDRHE